MGTDFSPLPLGCRPPGVVPQECLSPPAPAPRGVCAPRGTERWRKTGKPTRIFQIGQTCVQTKAALGGMRFRLLPNGADRSKWLVATEKYVISRSRWGSLSQLLPQRAHSGSSHSEGLRGQPLASRAPTWPCPLPSMGLQSFSGNRGGGGVPSLGYWWGDFKLPPGCGSPSSQCVVSVQGTPGWVGEWPLQPPEPRESTRGGGPVVFCCKCLRGTGGADG